jgi:UDP-glucose 4-epimerase
MRVLLTGASSFTGCWFAHALAEAGHEVTATLRGGSYDGLPGQRLSRLRRSCELVEDVAFGDERFLALLSKRPFDLLCAHGAQVAGYREPGFDVAAALHANTRSADRVVPQVPRLLVTTSVFEPGMGEGDGELRAFSAYGLSKAFTAETFRFHCQRHDVSFGRFVIATPFGPLEQPRFTTGLVRAWQRGEAGQVRTPGYVRDNIHVSLLARAYADFAGRMPAGGWSGCFAPSGYREQQGAFAERFAGELGPRLGLQASLQLAADQPWDEPAVRTNCDPLDAAALGWDEPSAWDELAGWYAATA